MTLRGTAPAFALALALTTAVATAALHPVVLTAPGPVSLKPGEELLIALPSNPTTGYSWAATISNTAVVRGEGSSYLAPGSTRMGAGGTQILAFESGRAGTATITVTYGRPWEKNVKAAKAMTFAVSVAK